MKSGNIQRSPSDQQFIWDYQNFALPPNDIFYFDTNVAINNPISGIQIINETDNPIQIRDGMDEQGLHIFDQSIADAATGSIVFSYGPDITVTLNAGEGAAEWKSQLEPYFGVGNVNVEGPYIIYGYWYIVSIAPGINAPDLEVISNDLKMADLTPVNLFINFTQDGSETTFIANVSSGDSSPILPVNAKEGSHIHLYVPRESGSAEPAVKVASGYIICNFFL